ncbi:spindle assembly abnormal protein 6 homolog [Styela clava]|uniref:spindle assembly abnormal protein 6 homolog n=1 Tax=Styela clava TaxID=7725 RepID=UPI00193933CE|nr:spindle assembly abnormal protein 6 homolog [Styela clava]
MTETLYSELHNVRYKTQDAEDRQVSIKITVEIQTTTSPLHRKDLLVRLTDDNDPFFLFNLCLGEEDFQSLKTQQGLLVDFSAFPQRFTGLLQQCRLEENKETPKFLLQFESSGNCGFQPSFSGSGNGSGLLNVIETNPFKHLTHLSLQFVPGNDSDVKKYLATCLKKTMEHRDKLESRLSSTERELGQMLEKTQSELKQKTKDLDKLRFDATGHTEKLSTLHAQDINSEREKALKIQSEMQQRHDRERKEMETSYQKTVRQLEKRLSDVENINKELTDRRYRAEATIREQKARLTGTDDELRRCRNELQQSRRENNALDAERHNQDKNLQQLKTRVAVIEQELLDKEQLMSRITSSLETSQDVKSQSEQRISEQQTQIRKLENTIKTMSEELLKGNEIIKRLQGELRGYMGKVKLRNEVTTRQEKLIGEKEQTMEKLKRDLDTATNNVKSREDEIGKLKNQLETTIEKLEESRGLLKTNENVISWLNKQLNERQIGSVSAVPPRHPTTVTSVPNHFTHSNVGIDPSSINSFKSQTRNPPQPNYSTPVGSTPQALHLSGPNITPGLGASPVIMPAPRPPILVGGAGDAGIRQMKPHPVSNRPQIRYNPATENQPPANKENFSPKPARDKSPAPGIDPKYLTCSSERNSSDSSNDSNAGNRHFSSLPQSNRLSQQALHQATIPPSRQGMTTRPRPIVGSDRVVVQSQPNVVSAYFTGAIPKSQPT